MRANRHHEEYLNHNEYILSDSALENSKYVVSAFKKKPLQPMPYDKERFSTKLARCRILAEHTIGILKGRFPWLKQIHMRITEDKKHLTRILKFVDCCIILHNLLLSTTTSEEERRIDKEDFSDIDDSTRAPTDMDTLTRPLRGIRNDKRRTRLKSYFETKEYM